MYVCMYVCVSPVLHDVGENDGHCFQLFQQVDVEVADSDAHHLALRIR